MNREELDENLENWLDRTAAEFGQADARPGFEARIIANLNSRLKERRWRRRCMSIAAACAAVLIGTLWALLPKFQDRATTETASKISGKIQPNLQQRLSRQSQPKTTSTRLPKNRNLRSPLVAKPRRNEQTDFLSSGLTDQERYLIAFVQAISADGVVTDTPYQSKSGPLQIPELEKIPEPEIPSIEIEALHIPKLNGNEEPL
jgi:hypothetical protein